LLRMEGSGRPTSLFALGAWPPVLTPCMGPRRYRLSCDVAVGLGLLPAALLGGGSTGRIASCHSFLVLTYRYLGR
jgi:hypothetical protein